MTEKRLAEITKELNEIAFRLFLYDKQEDYNQQLKLEKEYMEIINKGE